MTKSAEQVTEIVTTPKTYNVQELMTRFVTKSSTVRFLHSEGLTRSQILKIMKEMFPNMLYQHVRNILITPIKKT